VDVASPITTVVPSLDGHVLTVLASTTAPTALAEVHRRAGRGSKSGIRTVLLRMVSEGLVHAVPGGYVLNRDHLAAPAVEQLAGLHGELIDRLREAVRQWTIAPQLVGLFGSAARRDGDSDSDIDILIVSEAPNLEDLADELADLIRRWTGNDAHVIGRTAADIERMRRTGERILDEWSQDLVVISGDERALRGGT